MRVMNRDLFISKLIFAQNVLWQRLTYFVNQHHIFYITYGNDNGGAHILGACVCAAAVSHLCAD